MTSDLPSRSLTAEALSPRERLVHADHRWMNTTGGSWVCDMCDQLGFMGEVVGAVLYVKDPQ